MGYIYKEEKIVFNDNQELLNWLDKNILNEFRHDEVLNTAIENMKNTGELFIYIHHGVGLDED